MTRTEVQALIEKALQASRAESVEVKLSGGTEASTRFANSAITQNVAKSGATLSVRSAFGQRVGAARTNQFDDESIASTVRKSEEIARVSEPDTEYVGPVEPCTYAAVECWDDAIAGATPDDRARVVGAGIRCAENHGLTAAGSYATDALFSAIGNSRGLTAYHRRTSARYVCTAMAADSSGWAESASWTRAKTDPLAAAERAVAKALAGRAPADVEPGAYTVILEPAAATEMLEFMAWSMDAKDADEGTSAFAGKLGTKIAPEGISLASRPDHPDCPVTPFDEDGAALGAVDWVTGGTLVNLSTSRFWAQKTGRAFTGSPENLVMAGGTKTVDELVAETADGILVTRFWYIRFVDPMKLLLTGMTRDGLFRVRDGGIVGGARNLRFNDSPLRMLANTIALGKPVPTGAYIPTLVPPMKVEGFTFTSGTAF